MDAGSIARACAGFMAHGIEPRHLRMYRAFACGAVPMGFVYAAIGAAGQDYPTLAIVLNLAVPPVLWLGLHLMLRRRGNGGV